LRRQLDERLRLVPHVETLQDGGHVPQARKFPLSFVTLVAAEKVINRILKAAAKGCPPPEWGWGLKS
jgi:hypothetical protein